MSPSCRLTAVILLAQLWCLQTTCLEIQSLDGTNNNLVNPWWGATNSTMLRLMSPAFGGTNGQPAGSARPNARNVSNLLLSANQPNQLGGSATAWLTAWGTLITQDIASIGHQSNAFFNISVPAGDLYFDRYFSGAQNIPMARAVAGAADPRQAGATAPINVYSSFIDGSSIYGQNPAESESIRTGTGGLLKTFLHPVAGEIPLIDTSTNLLRFAHAASNIALHSVLVHVAVWREHNRFAKTLNQSWSDEDLFQYTRRYVIALIQQITYAQYLPPLLSGPLPLYSGYNSSVNPAIDVFFMAVTFRYGHSVVGDTTLSVEESGQIVGMVEMRKTFFNLDWLLSSGPEGYIRGLMNQPEAKSGAQYTDDLRNSLPLNGNQGYDLAAIDIQRGRELGIPDYNTARQFFNLSMASSYTAFNNSIAPAATLASLFPNISDIDAIVGALLEIPYKNGVVGALARASILDQFTRLRDGDRFFYRNPGVLDAFQMAQVQNMSLGKLLQLNFNLTSVPYNPCVYTAPSTSTTSGSLNSISLSSQLTLSWSISGSQITFTMEYTGAGWFAFGLGETMRNADIYYASYDIHGNISVVDAISRDFLMPTPATQALGYSRIFNIITFVSNDSASVTFSRALQSNDSSDGGTIADEDMSVIFAYSNSPTFSYHGVNRGATVVNFFSSQASGPSPTSLPSFLLLVIHAIVMFLSFAVIYPIGVLIVKHDPNISRGLRLHKETMEIISAFVLHTALTAILSATSAVIMNPHVILGFILTGLVIFVQVLGATIVYTKKNPKAVRCSGSIRMAHRVSGSTTYLLGAINCILGIQQFLSVNNITNMNYLAWIAGAWLVLVTLVISAGPIIFKFVQPTERPPSFDAEKWLTLPEFAWEEFHKRIAMGEKWLVVEGIVYDIKMIESTHPAGIQVLYCYLGMDATGPYHGRKARPELPSLPVHSHSKLAKVVLYEAAVGRLKRGRDFQSTKLLESKAVDLEKHCSPPVPGLSACQYDFYIITERELVTGSGARNPVYRIVVALSSPGEQIWFLPYQYVWLQFINEKGEAVTRAYTPTKSLNTGQIVFYIKFYPNGKMATYLESAKFVRMRGPIDDARTKRIMNPASPQGCFTQLALIAGGSGLTPMLLLVDYYLQHSSRQSDGGFSVPVKLFIINSTSADEFGKIELEQIEKDSRGGVKIVRFNSSSVNPLTGEPIDVIDSIIQQLPPAPTLEEQRLIRKVEKAKRPSPSKEVKRSHTTIEHDYSAVTSISGPENREAGKTSVTNRSGATDDGGQRTSQIISTRIIVCGPPAMNESINSRLDEAGYIDEMIILI
ncbi:heme peroxidase [Polychytrium aggregatum]|uniref:heme peroxidase n=1 Tax=Polychytrium aggregatum TaxID=110093 RepID=UPI0022FED5E2|nr:heme peroxidase [Polychytrium aggregatum]KAI9208402.1 heme peroxidase [Polychytrium aggregatum]